ncbi:hypothetical protein FB451DRAFT_1404763 [Mycena latifolia]|nr:hypothetical protein FB451DRAFT_1404763 [Mycena latifolia]
MTLYPPPICAQPTRDPWPLDLSATNGFAFPSSAPRDATVGMDASPQTFMPNYTDTAFPPQPAPVIEYNAYTFADATQYDAASFEQTLAFPPGAFIPEQATTFFPPDPSAQYMAQGLTYPAPNTLLQEGTYQQPMWATAEFMPALPAHLPQYPRIAPRTSQAAYQQQEYYATRPPPQPAPLPRVPVVGVPVPKQRGKRKRNDQDAQGDLPSGKRKRSPQVAFETKIDPQVVSPAVTLPPPTNQSWQRASSAAGSQQTTPPNFDPEHAHLQGHGYTLNARPPAGAPPTEVTMGQIRIEHLVFGKDNRPLRDPQNPLPKNAQLVVKVLSGPLLARLRKLEGNSFYGNELTDPRTGAPFVLRIMSRGEVHALLQRFRELKAMGMDVPLQVPPQNPAVSRPPVHNMRQNLERVPIPAPVQSTSTILLSPHMTGPSEEQRDHIVQAYTQNTQATALGTALPPNNDTTAEYDPGNFLTLSDDLEGVSAEEIGGIKAFFLPLALPALKTLDMKFFADTDDFWPTEVFSQFQTRSPNIEHISLLYSQICSEDLIDVLRLAPALAKLEIRNSWYCILDNILECLKYGGGDSVPLVPKLQDIYFECIALDFEEDILEGAIRSRWWTEQVPPGGAQQPVARLKSFYFSNLDEGLRLSDDLKARMNELAAQGLELDLS